MNWISLPVTLSPDCVGFLMSRPNGLRNYGLFVWLVQIAANMPKRGVLEDARGPLTAKRIAMMIRATEQEVEEGLKALSDPEIGLLSRSCTTSHDVARIPCMSVSLSVSSLESNETPKPGMKYPPGHVDQAFDAFFRAYPPSRQRARTTNRKFWIDNDLTAHAPKIMAALAKDKASEGWKKDGGKFVGNMAEWLDRDWTAVGPPVASGRHPKASDIRTWYDSLPPERQQEEASKANLKPSAVRELMNHHAVPEEIVLSWEASHVA